MLLQNQSEEGTLGSLFPSFYVAGIESFPALKLASKSFTGMEILFVSLAMNQKSCLCRLPSHWLLALLLPIYNQLGAGNLSVPIRDYHAIWEQFNRSSMRTNTQLGISRKNKTKQTPGPKYCLFVITLHLLIW